MDGRQQAFSRNSRSGARVYEAIQLRLVPLLATGLRSPSNTSFAKLSTHVRNYGDVFPSGCRSQPFGGDLGQKGVKIAARERPFEGRCRPLIVALEGKETLFEFGQRREVVGREDLPLDD